MSKSSNRVKNAAFISYPENGKHSALVAYLASSGYRAVVSPLHSPDGECTKPHYHVLVLLSSPRELSSLSSEFAEYKTTACFKVGDTRAYSRYLKHLDNPEKQQFSDSEPCTLVGGVDYAKLTFKPLAPSSVVDIYKRLDEICSDKRIYNYYNVVSYLVVAGDIEMLDYVTKHAYTVNLYIMQFGRWAWFDTLCDKYSIEEVERIFADAMKNYEV